MTFVLGESDPHTLSSDELASAIHSATVNSATKTIPAKQKFKFPKEFTKDTISLIHRKRKLWKFMQKSGVRVTRSIKDTYRAVCVETKRAIKADRNAKLELEAAELAQAFNQDTFKG